MTVRYLSQEWLDECHRLGAELPERVGASARIRYVIGGPAGATYAVTFVDGRIVSATLGEVDDADATLSMTYADGVAITRGELDPNSAFSSGVIGFAGDMRALMSLMPILWPSARGRLGSAVRYRAMYEHIKIMTDYRSE